MGRSGHVEMMRGVEELARKKIRFSAFRDMGRDLTMRELAGWKDEGTSM